jgi:hypothetical protein
MSRTLIDYDNPSSLASRLRRKRSYLIRRMIEGAHSRYGKCEILDLGGTFKYWNIIPEEFLGRYNVHITLLNVADAEVVAPFGRFSCTIGDACDLGRYADGQFDLVHSNSVIEHVGSLLSGEKSNKTIRSRCVSSQEFDRTMM